MEDANTEHKCNHKHITDKHIHTDATISNKLKFAIALTTLVLIAEVGGGIYTHSLALLSDAAHVFMDIFSLGLSLTALYLASRPATDTRTYGLHRTEVFAALINGVTLTIISIFIFEEAWKRFFNPPDIKEGTMMIVATGGMVANLIVVMVLRGHGHHDLNLRSAFLHVIGDFLASIGVILGGGIIYLTGYYVVDPILSIGIGALIFFGAFRVVRESAHILLEGVPRGIDVNSVADAIRQIEGVDDVHHLHIWSICSNIVALSSHILIDTDKVKDHNEMIGRVNEKLKSKFGILDTTLQLDLVPCANDALVEDIQHTRIPKLYSH